jgi:hypothetical protein
LNYTAGVISFIPFLTLNYFSLHQLKEKKMKLFVDENQKFNKKKKFNKKYKYNKNKNYLFILIKK